MDMKDAALIMARELVTRTEADELQKEFAKAVPGAKSGVEVSLTIGGSTIHHRTAQFREGQNLAYTSVVMVDGPTDLIALAMEDGKVAHHGLDYWSQYVLPESPEQMRYFMPNHEDWAQFSLVPALNCGA